MESSAQYFSRNLRRLRLKRRHREGGWRQKDLAERLGFHRNFIGMLERGERKPTLGTVDDLAEVFGIEPHELLMPPEEFPDG